jgi:acetolactate synthase-1/2/3 large subunit
MTPTVAEALADAMARHRVSEIFGQSLPTAFLLAAEARGIRQVAYRTENAGGAMADGYARASHRPGVVAAQNGPAATLLVPPLAEAMKASTPVVAVVQDVPTGHRDRNAFQEFDHFSLFASCAKWVRRLDDPARVDDYVDMAFAAATAARPGPAVLLVPKDVLAERAVPARLPRAAVMDHYPLDRPRPDAAAVRAAADAIVGARRPLVIAGGGVHSSQATAALAELQQLLGVPVATTVMGKGAVDEDDSFSAGVVGYFMGRRSMGHTLWPWLSEVDVVLLVGTRTNENGTGNWEVLPPHAKYLHLDVDAAEIGRNYESVRLLGDVHAGLVDLLAELRTRDLSVRNGSRHDVIRVLGESRLDHFASSEDVRLSTASPIRPERVMATLNAKLTPETTVVADASYSSIWVANYLRAKAPGQRFITPRGMAGLGWGLPMALGAKVAESGGPVVCVTGDGGFAHVWSELETAVREGISIVLIVLNNALLGYQRHAEERQFSAATSAVDIHRVDHAAIANACGANGIRVSETDLLDERLTEALAEQGPVVLDVDSDPGAFPPLTDWEDEQSQG